MSTGSSRKIGSPTKFMLLYVSVTVLTRKINICQKKLYVLFWMSYAMFVEAAFLN